MTTPKPGPDSDFSLVSVNAKQLLQNQYRHARGRPGRPSSAALCNAAGRVGQAPWAGSSVCSSWQWSQHQQISQFSAFLNCPWKLPKRSPWVTLCNHFARENALLVAWSYSAGHRPGIRACTRGRLVWVSRCELVFVPYQWMSIFFSLMTLTLTSFEQ